MTWAQAVFAFCFAVVAPVTGVLAGFQCYFHGRSPWWGLVIGTAVVLGVIVACSMLAICFFPDYPDEYVPEPLALCFTLPVLLGAMSAIWMVLPRSKLRRLPLVVSSAAILVVFLTGLYASYWFVTWPLRRALPWSATEIKEHAWSDGLLPDYSYHLKARIPESEFEPYARRVGLQPLSESDEAAGPDWMRNDEMDWWDPTPATEGTYGRAYSDGGTFAKYEDGFIYVYSFDM